MATGKQWILQGLMLAEGTLLTPTHPLHTHVHTHIRTHNMHTYGPTPQFTMKQCQVAKYTYRHHQCPLVTVVKGSLPWRSWVMPRGCWEGGVLRETVQGELIDSCGHTQQTSSQSTSTSTMYLNCQSRSRWHKHVLNNKGTLIQLGSYIEVLNM